LLRAQEKRAGRRGDVVPRFVDIQPGGAKYLSFALSKLRLLKAWMKPAGLRVMSKHFWVNPTDKIWIKALDMGNDIWWDWIRIEAGGGLWDFYVDGNSVWVAAIDGTLIATELTSILLSSRTLGRSWLLSTDGGELQVLNPNQQVEHVRDGDHDSGYTHELFEAGPTDGPSYAVLSLKTGVHRHFYTRDKLVELSSAVFDYHKLHATQTDFFCSRGTGTPTTDIDVFDLDGGSLHVEDLVSGGLPLRPESTFHDVLVYRERTTGIELLSKQTGETYSFDFQALGFTSAVVPALVTNRNAAYAFGSVDRAFSASSPFFDTVVACLVLNSVLDPDTGQLTGYTTATAGPTVIGDLFSNANLYGAAATRNAAFAFLDETTDSGNTPNLVSYSDAGIKTLVAAGVGLGTFLIAATPSNAWLVMTDGADTRIYNQSGLVQTFSFVTAGGGGQEAFVCAGRVGETAYFRARTSASQWRLIGSDGTNVDIRAGLPAGFVPASGVGGHTWRSELEGEFWVWGGTIPNPAAGEEGEPATIPYVFHRDTDPGESSAAFKSYAIPKTESVGVVNVPSLSTCFNHEEFED
jgi:hypothetical protein